jgi:hypothetical protein
VGLKLPEISLGPWHATDVRPQRWRGTRSSCCDNKKQEGRRHNDQSQDRNTGKWAAAREELLAREKEHTKLGDELARQRRELPWVQVEKEYRFDTDDGTRTLAELFDGRS